MSYTVYDFSESLTHVPISRDDILRVVAAWGVSGDYSEWDGGFLMEMKDGSAIYLTGWCDTTGWGCQDGVETIHYDAVPDYHDLVVVSDDYREKPSMWDEDPIDLNRYVRGEIYGWYEEGDTMTEAPVG